ncbi:MAG: LacI family DNA-binding transcriptional regulator, partial [Spirochaetia bacterium]|nr:LacI family DNA-binding transcriptional regulator [Spirochaetia bacterium]
LTRKLIALGHKKIAIQVGQTGWEKYKRGEFMHYSFVARVESYEAAMKAAGLKPIPLLGYNPDELASQLKAEDVTALIVHGEISMAYIQAAHKLGWEIPRELTVASLDIEARVPRPQVVGGFTYDRYAAGQKAAALLLEWLGAGKKSIPSETFTGDYREGDTIAGPRK